MRAIVLSVIIILGLGISLGATASSQLMNTTQLQLTAQQIPPPPSDMFQRISYFVAQAYFWLVDLFKSLLENTLLKANPGLAYAYANIIAWLIPLTAIYVLQSVFEVTRRLIGYVIAAGWTFLIIAIFLSR